MAANKRQYDLIPAELWSKFPKRWILMLENGTRIAIEVTMLLVAYLILYATLLGPPFRSQWAYLLTASLGPVAVAIWYIVFPLNPYRCMAAIREGMRDMDRSDQDARKLVKVLESTEAHRFLLNRASKMTICFFIPMAIIAAAMRKTPSWSFGADCAVRIPAFLFICLFVLFRIELLAWALNRWRNDAEGV